MIGTIFIKNCDIVISYNKPVSVTEFTKNYKYKCYSPQVNLKPCSIV